MGASSESAAGETSTAPTVLQVLPALVTGGVERGAVDVAQALVKAGWKAVVASAGGPMVKQLERAGARHVVLPLASKNPFTVWRNVERIAQLARETGARLIHARSRAPAWSALAAARRLGLPFVTTYHGTYNAGLPFKRFYNGVMARGDRVIAISHFIGRHVRERYGVEPPRLVVVPRGIDLTTFDPTRVTADRMITQLRALRIPEGVPTVMLPGRLTRWKGQAVLIEAMTRIERHDAQAVMVGDDQGRTDYRRELERLVVARGLSGRVHMPGPASDMPAAYMLADVVVSASTDPEAFGRVAVEAQAMGRPVVATDHGGSRETILTERTGWLVPPRDPETLAKAIDRALALDTAERARRAALAREHVEAHYTVDGMCKATLAIYAELLAPR
ncbi:MAG: glycosyltransferase family 4 protein [Alphaproteobacteria bacterium]|nr:glycosyltransferase family 4 protein [Alphaproteobacteria bacterium]